MLDAVEIRGWVSRLEGLLARKFGAAEGALDQRLHKIGRDLPGKIRRDVATVFEASRVASHPKLGLRHDHARVRDAFERAEAYLKTVDPKDRAKGRALTMLGSVMFNLLVFGALLLAFLVWRGLV